MITFKAPRFAVFGQHPVFGPHDEVRGYRARAVGYYVTEAYARAVAVRMNQAEENGAGDAWYEVREVTEGRLTWLPVRYFELVMPSEDIPF